ncbi:hypothetical protein TcWFU_006794 [Taenia crassiceps]|uniref:Uncharacterized protein n=1 Tax=Taenia crassiceps TaxID=6207 RepID=A0ABR4QS24_9CEST
MLTLPKIDRNRLPVAANDQMLPTTPPSLEDIDLANDDRIFSNLNLNWCPIRTHSAIQQMYASQDAIDKSASSSQDSKFIYYYPDLDKLRMHVSKIEDSKLEIERDKILKSISPLEPVLEGTESSVVKEEPGFILLSVKHEKIRNAQPAVRSGTGGHKATPMPQRKMSRKRLRKVTPSSYNPENVCAHGCELLSANDASTMDANANERSPASSRFRVTRIADSSSWWIPESSGMYICVHDLRTSSLPDFVTRQHQKILASLSGTAANYVECSRDFWSCLEPDYLQHVNKDAPISTYSVHT